MQAEWIPVLVDFTLALIPLSHVVRRRARVILR